MIRRLRRGSCLHRRHGTCECRFSLTSPFWVRVDHGYSPHKNDRSDPDLQSRFWVDVQALVSREIDPQDAAVVTVGSFHAGSNQHHSGLGQSASYRAVVHKRLQQAIDGIERMHAASAAADAPKPTVKFRTRNSQPQRKRSGSDPRGCRRHHHATGQRTGQAHCTANGAKTLDGLVMRVFRSACSALARSTVPSIKRRWKKGSRCHPSIQTFTLPDPEPSLKTGVLSMTTSILNEMPSKTGD